MAVRIVQWQQVDIALLLKTRHCTDISTVLSIQIVFRNSLNVL